MNDESNDRFLRRCFAGITVCGAAALVYASIVPVTPKAGEWNDAVAAFWSLPWFQLGVYRRADWAANALVVIPIGWMAAAAIDWGRRTRWPLMFAFPIIVAALCGLVAAIEFLQFWFPPRTRSLNDVYAGFVGAFLGPLLWWIFGRPLVRAFLGVRYAKLSKQRIGFGLAVYATAHLVFSALPLDIIVSWAEWNQKVEKGRVIFWPSDWAATINRGSLVSWCLAAIRSGVMAFFAVRSFGIRQGLLIATLFAVLCELVQVPIFTGKASVLDGLAGLVGVAGGACISRYWSLISAPLRYAPVWLAIGGTTLGLFFLRIFIRSTERVTDADEIAARWKLFWAWPFANDYFLSEFQAGSNFVARLFVFGVVGFCLRSAVIRTRPWLRRSVLVFGGSVSLAAGAMVEIFQVYWLPKIPDGSNILVYGLGLAIGYAMQWYLVPPQEIADDPSPKR